MNALVKKRKIVFTFYSKRQLSKTTVVNYTTAVRQYLDYIEKNHLEMNFQSISNWLQTFDNALTYNFKLQGVKAYFLKYFEHESMDKYLELERGFSSMKRKKARIAVDDSRYITYAEYQTLVSVDTLRQLKSYCHHNNELAGYSDDTIQRINLFIQALFWTGCRISELLSIKVKDCSTNTITLIKINNGKGGKDRLVYLQKDIYNKIRKAFNGKVYLFETRKGTQFNRLNVTRDIHRFAKKIIGRDISAHTLRHSKAMYLKEVRHLSPDQVAKALGHSSVLTTLQHYFHGTPTAEAQGIY